MGEYVQQTLEEMTNEVQQLERVGLFDHSEIKKIVSKRKRFEYKLRRRVKDKQDFLSYIEYERSVLDLVGVRRKINGYKHKKAEIEGAIFHRIQKLFRLACRNWPLACDLWFARIEFVKQTTKSKAQVSSLYTRMLQVITNRPNVWISAAKYEFEEIYAIDSARHILLKGISFNKSVHLLWHELFRLELLFVDNIRRREKIEDAALLRTISIPKYAEKGNVPDEVMSGKVACTVFTHAMKENPGVYDLAVGFIPVVKCFSWTAEVEDFIFNFMFEKFANNPHVYELRCSRFIESLDEKSPEFEEDLAKVQKKCEALLKQMIAMKSNKVTWSILLTINQKLLFAEKSEDTVHKLLVLIGVVERQGMLTELWMVKWIQMFCEVGEPEAILKLFGKAVSLFPSSDQLWTNYLRYAAIHSPDGCKHSLKLFHKSRKVRQDTLAVWEAIIGLCTGKLEVKDVMQLYELGVLCDEPLASVLKQQYIHWTFMTQGVKATRTIYKKLRRTVTVPEGLHKIYIEIEKCQSEPDFARLRKAYGNYMLEFGSTSVDPWLDVIAWERGNGEPWRLATLFSEAKRCLPDDKVDEFILKTTTAEA